MSDNPSPDLDKKRLFVCVFCGSSHGTDPAFAAAAKRLGELLAAHGYGLVFGGGNIGLMGEVARAVRDGGAPVKGILPEFLKHLEPPLTSKEEVVITPDLQTRKGVMLALADAFVVLPGGLGTFDEYLEVLTSAQLKAVVKPIVIADIAGYYEPLQALLAHAVRHGFAQPEVLALEHVARTADDAIAILNRLLAPRRPAT